MKNRKEVKQYFLEHETEAKELAFWYLSPKAEGCPFQDASACSDICYRAYPLGIDYGDRSVCPCNNPEIAGVTLRKDVLELLREILPEIKEERTPASKRKAYPDLSTMFDRCLLIGGPFDGMIAPIHPNENRYTAKQTIPGSKNDSVNYVYIRRTLQLGEAESLLVFGYQPLKDEVVLSMLLDREQHDYKTQLEDICEIFNIDIDDDIVQHIKKLIVGVKEALQKFSGG